MDQKVLKFKTNNVDNLSYALREALFSAAKLEDPEFGELKKEWRFSKEKDALIATRKLNVETVAALLEFSHTDQLDVMDIIVKNASNGITLHFTEIVDIKGMEDFLDEYDYSISKDGLLVKGVKEQNDE